MIELNHGGFQTPLAIETSGHAAFQENYNLDDGAYVVAKILMLLPELKQNNQTLGDLIAVSYTHLDVYKRQVGKPVMYLKRLRMGELWLDETLELGEYRPLTEAELQQLQPKQSYLN